MIYPLFTDLVSLDSLEIGDQFVVSNWMVKTRHSNSRVIWVEQNIVATSVMFLGFTNVYDGNICKEQYDNETGYYDPPCFVQTKVHRVLVVQPISNGRRYRRSFYILSPIQSSGYFPTSESAAKEKELQRRSILDG